MSDGRTPILYIAPWVDLGGSDKGTIDWFKHIDRERWAPSLITTQPSSNRWLHQVEPWAEEIWELPDIMPGAAFPAFILAFIESRGVRVVHIMNSRLAFDLMPDMTCLREPPAIVVQMHAEEPDQSGYVRYVTRRYGNLVDRFSVTSEQLKDAIVGYEIPPSRVEVIYSGVDGEEEFDPQRVEPFQLEGPAATPRILWPGRLVEQKDPMLTLDVLAGVRKRGVEFVLDVVGDGHMLPAVRERAAELGVADAIQWHPPSQEMARWYRSTDLLLMTSVFEGVPYVIYESLAMGVPVVAPALPGNLEFMNVDSGVLVDPRDDVQQYVDGVATLLSDEERRLAMGRRSRERMRAEFSLGEMGRRHDDLYERLLAGRPASSRRGTDELPDTGDASAAIAAGLPEAVELPRTPPPPRTVGVIVPCYRHGIYIDGCIASIRAQTLPAAAIVVVDDGSDDPETTDALARLEQASDVTVLRQPRNLGPSAARNRALAELDTSYVLPLDADDKLVPDALERMVEQLERLPPEVGFVYPNPQHFGNRSDFVQSPAYNLWLLTLNNYCPAAALFDRRVFDGEIAYPEDIVFGHEDWDLVLQLAERGIEGRPAEGTTFLYRRQGFSRVNAVEYGPQSFHEAIERRHPALYERRDLIKAQWAPALSIILLDDEDRRWEASDLAGRPDQSCRDFELIASRQVEDEVRVVGADAATHAEWLQTAIAAAPGRWICVLSPRSAAALHRRSMVEHMIHSWWGNADTGAVVLARAQGVRKPAFCQLDDNERLAASPVGVAFERQPEVPAPKLQAGLADSLLADLVLGLQAAGATQWRAAPMSEHADDSITERVPDDPGVAAIGRFQLHLDRSPVDDPAEALVRRALAWEPPHLPELAPGTVRRWEGAATWIPPETHPLCRHRSTVDGSRTVTTDRTPPEGYELEFDLGVVHNFALPGTSRLVEHDGRYALTDEQDAFDDDRRGLGHVEQAPLPLLELLEQRRLPESGEHVLVAGKHDPLYEVTAPLSQLGWIEPFPIHPHEISIHTGLWGVSRLCRETDAAAWRHRYRPWRLDEEPPDHAIVLGALLQEPAEGLIPLSLRPDGRLESDILALAATRLDVAATTRWMAAPLTWQGRQPRPWAVRATGSRVRHLARAGRRTEPDGASTPIGWVRREAAPGYRALFSATHPATGDQFVTRSEIEATDLGYRPDGVLGHILDAGADRSQAAQPREILWASRFGKERRYVEGPIPR